MLFGYNKKIDKYKRTCENRDCYQVIQILHMILHGINDVLNINENMTLWERKIKELSASNRWTWNVFVVLSSVRNTLQSTLCYAIYWYTSQWTVLRYSSRNAVDPNECASRVRKYKIIHVIFHGINNVLNLHENMTLWERKIKELSASNRCTCLFCCVFFLGGVGCIVFCEKHSAVNVVLCYLLIYIPMNFFFLRYSSRNAVDLDPNVPPNVPPWVKKFITCYLVYNKFRRNLFILLRKCESIVSGHHYLILWES